MSLMNFIFQGTMNLVKIPFLIEIDSIHVDKCTLCFRQNRVTNNQKLCWPSISNSTQQKSPYKLCQAIIRVKMRSSSYVQNVLFYTRWTHCKNVKTFWHAKMWSSRIKYVQNVEGDERIWSIWVIHDERILLEWELSFKVTCST